MAEQVDRVQFELSRHVLKKVVKAIRTHSHSDASWLSIEFIRPSTEYGIPITVDSDEPELCKIQNLWAQAIKRDPTIKGEGALILNAKKNGSPVTGLDYVKYHVEPDAVQSNVLSAAEVVRSQPYQPKQGPTSQPGNHIDSFGGLQVRVPSPSAISATSTLRSCTSPKIPDHIMMHTPQANESKKSDSMPGSYQQRARRIRGHNDEGGETLRRPRGYSGSTAYSSAMTTVTFQAHVNTGGNITAIPFDLDTIHEAIDDIVAYVDWKNSEGGRIAPVDFKTFLSIMRFRPGTSNALVHKA